MDKQTKMFRLIDLWEKSGQSQPDFCASHGITVASFGYWRTKWLALHPPLLKVPHNGVNKTLPMPLFVPIVKNEAEPVGKPQPAVITEASNIYEIIYPNGVRLRLPSLDLLVLKQLIDLHV